MAGHVELILKALGMHAVSTHTHTHAEAGTAPAGPSRQSWEVGNDGRPERDRWQNRYRKQVVLRVAARANRMVTSDAIDVTTGGSTMAFARLALFPGGTEEQHQAIVEGLGDSHVNPKGRIMFAAGPTAEGWQNIQVWETREQLERWVQDNLGEAFARAGARGYPAPPRITDFEVRDLLMGPAVATR